MELAILSLFAISCIVLNFCSSPVSVFLRVYLPLLEILIPNASQIFSFDILEMYLTPRVAASFLRSLTFEYSFRARHHHFLEEDYFFSRFLSGFSSLLSPDFF